MRALLPELLDQFEAGHLLGEYDKNAEAIQETIWLGDLPVAVIQPGAGAIVVDNATPGRTTSTGTWSADTGGQNEWAGNVPIHAAGSGTDRFSWKLPIASAGAYNVYARWSAGPDRASDAQYTITTASGSISASADQQRHDGPWPPTPSPGSASRWCRRGGRFFRI